MPEPEGTPTEQAIDPEAVCTPDRTPALASTPQLARLLQGVRPVVLASFAFLKPALDSGALIAAAVYVAVACVLNAHVPRRRAVAVAVWVLLLACDLGWVTAALLHFGVPHGLVPLGYGLVVGLIILLTSRTLGLETGMLAITCYCAAAVVYSSVLVNAVIEQTVAYLIAGISLAGGLIGYVVNESHKLDTSRLAHQRIHTLVLATEAVASGEESGSVWPSVASYAAGVVEARRTWVVSVDPASSALRVRAVYGPRSALQAPALNPEDPGLAAEILKSGHGVLIADHARRDSRLSAAERLLVEDHLIAAPIATTDTVLGVVLATRRGATRAFTPDDLRALTLLGRTVGFRIQNVRLIRALKQQATHDSLTGLLNHGSFLEEVDMQVELARLGRERLSLVLIDMDEFKQVNDRAGHAEGNRLLQELSETLRCTFRAGDVLGRCGGDEFGVLLRGVGGEEASQISRRAAAAVRSLREAMGLPARTSASWGIACFPDDARSTDDLFRKADARLYAAKRAGGDRVAFGDREVDRVSG
ncbi:MAG: sensor domain-containing diguanylate cyclase [Armatimonadetes bacterium]|nr:sensor domain-containing diguanylate cyclase [Armatimonadota bacterium]